MPSQGSERAGAPAQGSARVEVRPSAAGVVGIAILATLLVVLGGAMVAATTVIDRWEGSSIAAGIAGVVIAFSGALVLVAIPRISAPAWLTFHPDGLDYIGRPVNLTLSWQDVEWLYLTAPGKLALLGVRWSPLVQLIIRVGPEAAATQAAARGRVGKPPTVWDHSRVLLLWAGAESKRAIAAACEAYAGDRFQAPRL